MKSLSGKLTVAFVAIGLLSVLIFSALLAVQTQNAFNRFVADRERDYVMGGMQAMMRQHQGATAGLDQQPFGDSLDAWLTTGAGRGLMANDVLVADADGVIVRGAAGHRVGETLSGTLLAGANKILENGQVVGYVALLEPSEGQPPARTPLEVELRQQVTRAAVGAGLFAMLAGLVVSGAVARTFSRPITELTDATRAMAAGALHQQVPVRTQDELGVLAHSFNRMSADLAQSSQSRKQMTADLAHDLRTPLTVLRGYSEGLLEGRVPGSSQIYSIMYEEVVHLQRLVEDLRTLSLADAGELSLNRRLIDPAALLERAGLAHMQAALDKGIELQVQAADGLPNVFVDTDRLAQVLNNLVANALRHTGEGTVLLAAYAETGEPGKPFVRFEVSDSGDGIAAEDLPFVFDRFYRGDKSRTRSQTGEGGATVSRDSSGLGLAIARAIVEAHGGAISVNSETGKGSTFVVRLPAGSNSSGADGMAPRDSVASSNEAILIG